MYFDCQFQYLLSNSKVKLTFYKKSKIIDDIQLNYVMNKNNESLFLKYAKLIHCKKHVFSLPILCLDSKMEE